MIRELFLKDLSLWGCVWQSTLFAVMGLVGSFLLRRRPARASQVLFLAMIAAVLVPGISVLVKYFELGLFTEEPISLPSVVKDISVGTSVVPASLETRTDDYEGVTDFELIEAGSGCANIPWRPIVLYGWMIVILILLGRLFAAFFSGHCLLRRAQSRGCEQIQRAADYARARLGITKDLQVRSSKDVRSPVIWCWSPTPVLLVPGDLDDRVDWEGVISHELAHWRRWDHVSGFIAELIVCILWWNPLLWWSKKRMVRLSEQACDDWVLSDGQPCEDYAQSLLNFKPQRQVAFVPAVVHSRRGLASRVRRILKDSCCNPRVGAGWTLVVSMVAVLLTVGVAFAQTRPAEPKEKLYKQSKIIFSSKINVNPEIYVMNREIYVMNADGSEQKKLTNNPAFDTRPSWSPDGKKVVFSSNRDRNSKREIYVMNADGSEQKRLTNNPTYDSRPSWSPDGKKIAFVSVRDGNYEIYVMNADGTEQINLTNNPSGDTRPSWSPDGKKIAFESERDGNGEIYFMNPDGSEQKRLTNNSVFDKEPAWSPDGKKIAFSSNRDGNEEIYVMNVDGSGQKRLTNNPGPDQGPTWSPDGKKLAFSSNRDGNRYGNRDIYVMNADGSEQRNLTISYSADDINPCWSPFLSSEK